VNQEEWIWVAIVVAIPVILFGTAEFVMRVRRRRYRAIATRREGPRRRSGRTG
jgi:hypothetical protein